MLYLCTVFMGIMRNAWGWGVMWQCMWGAQKELALVVARDRRKGKREGGRREQGREREKTRRKGETRSGKGRGRGREQKQKVELERGRGE